MSGAKQLGGALGVALKPVDLGAERRLLVFEPLHDCLHEGFVFCYVVEAGPGQELLARGLLSLRGAVERRHRLMPDLVLSVGQDRLDGDLMGQTEIDASLCLAREGH